MDHKHCSHPSTKAGRAKCRRNRKEVVPLPDVVGFEDEEVDLSDWDDISHLTDRDY